MRIGNSCWIILFFLWMTVHHAMAKDDREDDGALHRLSSEELMEKGRNNFSQRNPAKALACFTIVCKRKADNQEQLQLRIRALNNCGCVYKFSYFDYIRAYEYFIKAYDLCEQVGYDDFLPIIMVNLGDLFNDYSLNYDSKPLAKQAKELFDKCISKAYETKNWELLTTSFFNLANQNYQLDLKKYNMLFSKEIPDSTPDLAYARLQYQGIQFMQQHQYDKARECFERQMQNINTRWAPERDSLASYMSIASTYQQEKDYLHAIECLTKALQLTFDKKLNDLSPGICRKLSEQYHIMGDEEQSASYHQRYIEMMDKTHAKQLAHIAELNYISQLEKKEKHTQELEQRQRLQQLIILAGMFVLVVVLTTAIILWDKNRQVKRVEADEQSLRKAYSRSSLNDEQRESLVLRIEETLNDADVICQQDFTLNKLAKLINSNTTYTSQVINEKYGMTFSNLLGSRRVKIACQWMDNPERYGNITIEAIASGTGFKSRTAFVNAFKRETGLKPSEYLRMAISKQE